MCSKLLSCGIFHLLRKQLLSFDTDLGQTNFVSRYASHVSHDMGHAIPHAMHMHIHHCHGVLILSPFKLMGAKLLIIYCQGVVISIIS